MTTDPFFSYSKNDPTWNACIGTQAGEMNYVSGYMEAALELSNLIIDKEMYGKRDTLVFPILYNARHAIEITLKMVINNLVSCDIIEKNHIKNHDISSHFKHILESYIPDELLRLHIPKLKPFIDSLSKIDKDGQELRYHQNKDGNESLQEHSLTNILIIRKSLLELSKIMDDLVNLCFKLCLDRVTKAHTNFCSRNDLFRISEILPNRSEWKSSAFTSAKKDIKKRYNLTGRKFSKALEKIQENRQMRKNIGIESEMLHISDEKSIFLVKKWILLHPPQKKKTDLGIDFFDVSRHEEYQKDSKKRESILTDIQNNLTEDEFSDVLVIFYIARDGIFSELYQSEYDDWQRRKVISLGNFRQQIKHVMMKTNFLKCFSEGITILGRPSLTKKLHEIPSTSS